MSERPKIKFLYKLQIIRIGLSYNCGRKEGKNFIRIIKYNLAAAYFATRNKSDITIHTDSL